MSPLYRWEGGGWLPTSRTLLGERGRGSRAPGLQELPPEASSLPGLEVSTWETLGPGPKPGPAPDPSEPRPLHTAGRPPALFCLVNSRGQVAVPGLDGPPGLLAYDVGSLATRVQGNPLPGVPRGRPVAKNTLADGCPPPSAHHAPPLPTAEASLLWPPELCASRCFTRPWSRSGPSQQTGQR